MNLLLFLSEIESILDTQPQPRRHQDPSYIRRMLVVALIVFYTVAVDLISSSGCLGLAMCRTDLFYFRTWCKDHKCPIIVQTAWTARED